MYDFGIGDNILAESGLEFAELWNDSRTRYKGGDKYLSDTEETQAAAYFNLGQQIGRFYYQIGVRGEYLYKYRAEGTDANSKPFSFLPTISLGYDFSDAVNVTVGCDKILYSNQRTWEKYKMISTYNQNFQFDRQFRIGIAYNFSNFRDLFKKNDSNADILQRAL